VGVGADLIRTITVPTPFPVGPVNVYLVTLAPVTLVDSGPLTDEAWEALSAGLARAGLKVTDVERVLLTHGHQDHFGLAQKVADLSGARLLGGRPDRALFRMRRDVKLMLDNVARADFGLGARLLMMASVCHVEHFATPLSAWDELVGGETLPGYGWSVVVRRAPGHTPGSLTFEIPEAGVLFTGDTVLRDITPNAIVEEDPERPGAPFRSVTRYFETLDAIEETNPDSSLLTGHGRSIPDYRSHLEKVKRKYVLRVHHIERFLASGPKTVRDLVVALFPNVEAVNVFLAYSEVLGFLMYLEDEGRVERLAGPVRDRYRLIPR
jgi:glyoxylase-like metal-dependent hydrolase (beta-lactamase superfamily II)